jgi:hypothetical protein
MGLVKSGLRILLAVLTITCLYSGAFASYIPNPKPFDPNAQDFTVVAYDYSEIGGARIGTVLTNLGIVATVRTPWDPITASDLDAADVVIIGECEGEESTHQLDGSLFPEYITGRVVVTGHDPDYHMYMENKPGGKAAAKFLRNAILFVRKDPGKGMIVLGDKAHMFAPFSYLPQSWGIVPTVVPSADGPVIGGDYIVWPFTDQGLASGMYNSLDPNYTLDPNQMSYWDDSFHDFFTYGPDFMPFENGSGPIDGVTRNGVTTIARGNLNGITLTKADDINRAITPSVGPGTRVTFSVTCNYPSGNGPTLNGIAISDPLPVSITYVAGSASVTRGT